MRDPAQSRVVEDFYMTPAIETRALRKCYSELVALESLDLRIAPGEIYCLLGANGAGKTTTINLLLGFVPPTSGSAHVAGFDVSHDPVESKRHLAYVPEQVALYERLSGAENLRYFLDLAGQKTTPAERREYLLQAGLEARVHDQPVASYSKGMRQKVALATAAARSVTVLLLDEPTSGLDPKAANDLSRLIRELSTKGAAVLMATHDLFRVKEVGHQVGIMRQGQLVASLHTDEVDHAGLEQIYLEHMQK